MHTISKFAVLIMTPLVALHSVGCAKDDTVDSADDTSAEDDIAADDQSADDTSKPEPTQKPQDDDMADDMEADDEEEPGKPDSGTKPKPEPEEDAGRPEEDAGPVVPPPVMFSETELARLMTLSPLPAAPSDPTNQYADNANAAKLGQMLFFDAKFSGALDLDSDLGKKGDVEKVSCASCHSGPALDDRRSGKVSIGAKLHKRNAPGIVNSVFYAWTNWGGRFSAQWELPMVVAENAGIMNGNRLQIAHRLYATYKTEYEAAFGAFPADLSAELLRFPLAGKPKAVDGVDGDWESMTPEDQGTINRILVNYSKALHAYMRLLISRDSGLDQLVAGKDDALSDSEKRGASLFVGKAGCVTCHSGPHLSDGGFHNLGVPNEGAAIDMGRFGDVGGLLSSGFNSAGAYSDDVTTGRLAGLTNPMPNSSKATFRTPSLRGVADTAPYMHAGQFATLADVINFYDAGGGAAAEGSTKSGNMVPLHLTKNEKLDLEAFLKALSGQNVQASLVQNTAKP